jgi:hypothetical protein
MHNEAVVSEYEVANENIRYCGNLKLVEVTIFVGVTGGLTQSRSRLILQRLCQEVLGIPLTHE